MYPNHCFFVGGISLLLGMKHDAASSLFEHVAGEQDQEQRLLTMRRRDCTEAG